MKLDVYSPCPGGLNNKIKFCCADLLHVLDTIQGQLDGEQAHSALESIDRQLTATPDRPCLLALRIEALEMAGKGANREEILQAIQQFRQRFPENPIALAYSAIARLNDLPAYPEAASFDDAGRAAIEQFIQDRHEVCVEAIDNLQTALTICERNIPYPLYTAFGGICGGLLSNRMYVPVFQHLLVQARLAGDDSARMDGVYRYLQETLISPFLKTEFRFRYLEDDTPWREEYNEAARLGNRCQWRSALARFEELHERVGDHPLLLRAIYMASASLGLNARAIDALRKVASKTDDPLQAIEAEATALELEILGAHYREFLVHYEVPIDDANTALERIQSDPRVIVVPVNPEAVRETPPPKATFLVADRPARGVEPINKLSDVPLVCISAALYGKETDRPARLEWITRDTQQREQSLELMRDILGDYWREPKIELVGFRLDAEEPAGNARVFDAASPELRSQPDLMEQIRNDRLERWLDRPSAVFGGKSPRKAADDPAMRRRLQALLLIEETRADSPLTADAAERIRRDLGLEPLPAQLTIDPDADDLPLWRLSRLDVAATKTPQLIALFGLAVRCQLSNAVERLGKELLRRSEDGEDISIPVDRLYFVLSTAVSDYATKVQYLLDAEAATVKLGNSPAEYLLSEVMVHLSNRGTDVDRLRRVLEMLTTRYNTEPGILDKLRQLLDSFGLLGADGRVRIPRATTTTTVVGAPAAEPTPAEPPPAPPSKLWLPGDE